MEKVYFIDCIVLDEGLNFNVKEYKVLNESETTIILNTESFLKVKKGTKTNSMEDFLGEYNFVSSSKNGLLGARGYFGSEKAGKVILKEAIKEYLREEIAKADKLRKILGFIN